MSYKKERIKYIDTLKFVAIFGIIAIHMVQIWRGAEVLNFGIINFQQIFRYGVPVFLMVSGSLLLNKEIELKEFFKKRFIRILLPLIFYSIIIILLDLLNGKFKIPFTTFWYCWMIIGAYLAIPVVNIFIKNAKMREIEYFLILFILATLIYQLAIFFNIKHSLDLNFFLGPISFMILGYYLSKKEFKLSVNKTIIISIIGFIVITILQMKFSSFFNFNTGNLVSHLTMNVLIIIQSSTIFLMFKNLYEVKEGILLKIKNLLESNIVNKFILSVSRASYGMYLFHIIIFYEFIKSYLKGLPLTGTQVCICIFISTVSIFLLSWLVTLILGQIPYIKKLSGYY